MSNESKGNIAIGHSSRAKNKMQLEIWDMIRHANAEDKKIKCSANACKRAVVSVWATNLDPKAEWFTCEECQDDEFDGWPEGEEPESNREAATEQEAGEAEIWDVVRHANVDDEKTPCSNNGCKRTVVGVWASNLNPNEWFTCEECQKQDFNVKGWPKEDIPKSKKGKPSTLEAKAKSKNNPRSSIKKRSYVEKNASSCKSQPKTKNRKAMEIDNSITLTASKPTHRTKSASQLRKMQPFPLPLRAKQNGLPSPMQRPPPLATQCLPPLVARVVSPMLPRPPPRFPANNVAEPQVGVPNQVAEGRESKSKSKLSDHRDMITIRYRITSERNNNKSKPWAASNVLHSIPNTPTHQEEYSYNLRRGGNLKVIPNMIGPEMLARLEKEILNCGLFRQYSLQAQDEPRLHFLLHENATDDFKALQPGYSYAKVWVKARPLSKLPLLERLAKDLADWFGVKSWNIGVHPVLYRGSNDSMGEHADDDQGEEKILCLIVSSPKGPRCVRISPKAKGEAAEIGDERLDLMMSPGDAYLMDKQMQQHYFHSVPKTTNTVVSEDSFRLSIVFRTGSDFMQWQDSGQPCENLAPKARPLQLFGNGILGLFEGETYTRSELFNMGAHRMQQRGISGKMKAGADAMIVSGLREDKLGRDYFHQLVYAVEQCKGGMSVMTSSKKGLPIRVFRSSNYESPYKANSMADAKNASTRYRYDGLYKVVTSCKPLENKNLFIFELHRLEAGSDEHSNRIDNKKVLAEYTQMGTMQTQEAYTEVKYRRGLMESVVAMARIQNEDSIRAEIGRMEDPPRLNPCVG
ncbi:MAG: hypothetical protein SGBAC_013116 [Bacillariaceae sp.]